MLIWFGINSFQLAQANYEESTTCRIDEQGNIWKNTYKNVWKEDLSKKGVKGNKIVDYKLAGTDVFTINDSGTVVQLKELPVDDRASLD